MIRKVIAVLMGVAGVVLAQDTPAKEKTESTTRDRLGLLMEVKVATKSSKPISELPYMTWFLDADQQVLGNQSRSLTESLKYVPGVLLQSTGPGMTSPYLRGFTSQRTALFADGVRVNNSFLREGPNQYWNQIDHFFYDETEVLFGPSSVLYGSDAVGGTVLTNSTIARGQEGAGVQWLGGEAVLRRSSAEHSFAEHIKGTYAVDDKLSFKFGFTRQEFGDLESGRGETNKGTAYDQWAANFRVKYWLDEDNAFVFGYEKFDQDDTNRVHRTINHLDFYGTALKSGSKGDFARIYDQDRQMAFARYEKRNGSGLFEEVDFGVSYQNFVEHYNQIRNVGDEDKRFTRIETYGLNVRALSDAGIGKLTWGLDHYHDDVHASRVRDDLGAITVYDQGLIANDGRYDLTGAYLQLETPISASFDLIAGVRYDYAEMEAGEVDNLEGDASDSNGITNPLSGNWRAATGSIRGIYKLMDDSCNLYAGISQGFRAPNFSDATRYDEFGGGAEAPTANLSEEHFTTYEGGLKSFGDWGFIAVGYFYTHIKDRIGRMNDPADTKVNLDDGHIHGAEINLKVNLTESVSVNNGVTWQEGEEWTYYNRDTSSYKTDYPMSRMAPLSGTINLRYAPRLAKYWVEGGMDWADRQDRMTDSEEDREDPLSGDNRFAPGGTPGYQVFNIRTGLALTESMDVAFAIENLTDEKYRIHGSGINEPGRNFILSLRYKF